METLNKICLEEREHRAQTQRIGLGFLMFGAIGLLASVVIGAEFGDVAGVFAAGAASGLLGMGMLHCIMGMDR